MKRLKCLVVGAIAVVIAAAYSLPALPVSAASSAALSIVPKKNYVVEPGKSVKDKLTIRNLDTTRSLDLSLRVIDFTFTDDGGTPKLMLDQNAPQTTWSLKPYLRVPETVSVPAGSSKSLDMSVSIPAGHGAGSYYSAIIYSSGAPSGGGNVGLSASGVTLVFASIPGKVNENLKLEKFGAYTKATPQRKAEYNFISSEEPQVIAYTLKNNGNVTEAPVGSITIKSMFGNAITISNINPSGSLALIGQTRTFTSCIKLKSQEVDFNGSKTEATTCASPGLWPGLYTASIDIFYGQNGNNTQETVGTSTFWYLPTWFVILFLIVLAVVAYFAWRLVRIVRSKLFGKSYAQSRRKK